MITGPCEWPLIFGNAALTAFDKLDEDLEEGAPKLSDAVKAAAVDFLWNWTGRVYGPCEITVDLCLEGCTPTISSTWITPSRTAFDPKFIRACEPDCDCGKDCTMARLPWPVHSVAEVQIDGTTVEAADYRIINRRFVQLTNGDTWPQCGEGPVRITYSKGLTVPKGGQVAAGTLALEMAKALTRDPSCQLPRRIQSIARQGIDMTMVDNFAELDEGKTGLWLVDSWIASVTRPGRGGQVRSVDRVAPGSVRHAR